MSPAQTATSSSAVATSTNINQLLKTRATIAEMIRQPLIVAALSLCRAVFFTWLPSKVVMESRRMSGIVTMYSTYLVPQVPQSPHVDEIGRRATLLLLQSGDDGPQLAGGRFERLTQPLGGRN
mgnify:CR=1 FL=1